MSGQCCPECVDGKYSMSVFVSNKNKEELFVTLLAITGKQV